jgi:uncharacterized protein YkwD
LPTFPIKPATIAAVACVAALAGPSVAGAAICGPDATTDPAVSGTARAEAATHCLINSARAIRGLWALGGNPYLYNPAVAHSVDMAHMGVQSHVGSDGSTNVQRLVGYTDFMSAWGVAENIHSGPRMTPYQAVYGGLPGFTSWMQSALLHRRVRLGKPQVGPRSLGGRPP